MSITILEPGSDQEIKNPVTVVAGYFFANAFDLTCKVGAASSADSPKSLSGDSTHSSDPITVRPGTYTVTADGTNSAGGDSHPNVTVTSGKLSVDVDYVINVKPVERGMKTVKVAGRCNPKTKAKYVICRVIEVNLQTMTRELVGSGAGTTEGKNLIWKVVVSFRAKQARRYQYVAQITAYNLEDQPTGQITKFIKK